MCGVLAVGARGVGGAPACDDRRVLRAMARLRPRGPDGCGVWRDGGGRVLLGHTRLAVVDLSEGGSQPMVCGASGSALSFNGEIYNAGVLRESLRARGVRFRSVSDTEVLLAGCVEWGVGETLERLRGMFAFVFWDARGGELHAAVDHAGIKPLVWRERGGSVVLGSDLDVLRHADPVGWEIDGDGLADVLCRGYCAGPGTVWRGARRLCGGEWLRWSAGRGVRVSRWWTAPDVSDGPALGAEELWGMVRESASRHTVSDVGVGALLSSGLDSSAVVAGATAGGGSPSCLTLAMSGEHDESEGAAETARALGCAHERVSLGEAELSGLAEGVGALFDEPQGYGGLMTMLAVSRAASRRAKVVLSGDGGDELLGGYAWHRERPWFGGSVDVRGGAEAFGDDVFGASAGARWRALDGLGASSFACGYQQAVMRRFHPAEARALLSPVGCGYGVEAYGGAVAGWDAPGMGWPRRAQRVDLLGFCAGSVLAKVDRASAGVGLEVRVPLLDRDLLERCLSARVAGSSMEFKGVLRAALRGRLPWGAVDRPKQGFSLRVVGPEYWEGRRAALRDSALVRDGVIDGRWERLVADGVPYRDGRVLALVMLEAWYRERTAGGERLGSPLGAGTGGVAAA